MESKDFESFKNPDRLYRGTDFWMLNGKLDGDEIVRQLTEMKNQGFASFIARTYVGLESDYPGEDFMSKMRLIVDTAKSLDLRVYLQAGYMPDSIVDLPREYAIRCIVPEKGNAENGGKTVLSKDNVDYKEKTEEGFLDIFSSDAVDYYIKVSYLDMWRHLAPEFGKTVESIWIDEPSYPASHLPYPFGIEDKFFKRYGYKLEDNLDALFIDRAGYQKVRYDYRRLLADLLEENFFKKISEWCKAHGIFMSGHLLFEETMELQISRAAAVMPYYKYLDIPGIDVLCAQQNWNHGRIKPFSPGEYRYREVMMTTPIQCASAARQAGREHILAEMFGVTSEAFGPREQKYMQDVLAAHGINHRSIHGIFYSLKGRGKRLYPPHVNYYQPYFKSYGIMNDYTARLSRFATLGKAVKDTLVIHPLESAYIEYTARREIPVTGLQPSRERLIRRDAGFSKLINSLTLSGCEFDLGDEGSIAFFGKTEGGVFTVGKMSYKTVVLPDLSVIRRSTLDLLSKFKNEGGRIIVLGKKPTLIEGDACGELINNALSGVECALDVGELSAMISRRGYTLSTLEGGASVIVTRRRSDEYEYYYLVNTDCSSKKHVTLTVEGEYTAEEWFPMNGTSDILPSTLDNGKTVLEFTLPEGGNKLLALTRGGGKGEPPKNEVKKVLELKAPLSVKRDSPNALLLEFAKFKTTYRDFSDEYPILAIQHLLEDDGYSGDVTLEFNFKSEMDIDGSFLALEDSEMVSVELNGVRVPSLKCGYYVSRDFETLALPRIRRGENVITVKRYFSPPDRKYGGGKSLFISRGGTSLEAMYLIGDFAVNMIPEPERTGNLRYSRFGIVLSEEKTRVSGELTGEGYPFFAGGVSLSSEFSWDGTTDGAELVIDSVMGSVASVKVNDTELGTILAPPYRLSIGHALKKGRNILTLHLNGTLRNLLGPHHNPYGERGGVRGDYDNSDLGWMGVRDKDDKEWYDNRTPDTDLWCESYLLYPFGIFGIRIEK